MKPTKCLRLARRSLASHGFPSTQSNALHASSSAINTPQLRPTTRSSPATILGHTWDSYRSYSRFSDDPYDNEVVSPFKTQRQKQLRQDRESDDPLWTESHPRLVSDDKRISVSDFLETFHDRIPTESITLCGRVRSKRVVGKNLIFVDIVNEFQRAQVLINKKKCEHSQPGRPHRFELFRNMIQVGDHICESSNNLYLPHTTLHR